MYWTIINFVLKPKHKFRTQHYLMFSIYNFFIKNRKNHGLSFFEISCQQIKNRLTQDHIGHLRERNVTRATTLDSDKLRFKYHLCNFLLRCPWVNLKPYFTHLGNGNKTYLKLTNLYRYMQSMVLHKY